MKQHQLLHQRKPRKAALYQASKLYELLPQKPNDLWQMDVTYIHIPGHGWWYAITVIDYYSRYLLTARFTSSYSAREIVQALAEARVEAERIHGPLPHNQRVCSRSSDRAAQMAGLGPWSQGEP